MGCSPPSRPILVYAILLVADQTVAVAIRKTKQALARWLSSAAEVWPLESSSSMESPISAAEMNPLPSRSSASKAFLSSSRRN